MKDMLLESYKKNAWLFDRLLGEGTDSYDEEELDTEDEDDIDVDEESDDESDDEELDFDEESDDEESDDEDDEDVEEDEDDEEDDANDIVDLDDINGDLEDRVEALEDKVETLDHSDDDEVFEVDLANPVCPCCGARLNIKGAGTEEFTNLAGELTDDDEDDEAVDLNDETEDSDETTGEEITFADHDFLDKADTDNEDFVDLTSMFDDDTEESIED